MEEKFPFATHGRSIWADEHTYFDYDNRAFGRIAVEELVKHGRNKILLLAPPLDQNYGVEILEGAQESAAENNVEIVVAQGIDSDSHRSLVREYVSKIVGEDASIDGLISASPNATMAAIAGIEDAGLILGKTFDVFSKETIPILELFRSGILTANEDVTTAGHFLAKAAVHAAQNPNEPPMQHLDHP